MSNLPTTQDFQMMKEMGQMAIKSGLLPKSISTPEQAIIIIMKGRELGIPPMQAFSSIAVVNGKPTMSAELMVSMIYRNVPGAVIDYVKTTNIECMIEAQRPGGKRTPFTFTMEDAKRAQLTGKGPWITYPSAMLRARCVSAMARAMFADALSGVVYTPEELGAKIDDDGDVVEIGTLFESPKVVTQKISVEPKRPDVFAKEPPRVGSAKPHDPGSFVISCGKKEWRTKTIQQVVDVIGLAEFQKEMHWWANESNARTRDDIRKLASELDCYAAVKKLEAERAKASTLTPPPGWQDEDFDDKFEYAEGVPPKGTMTGKYTYDEGE